MSTTTRQVLDNATIVQLPLAGNKLIEASAGTGKTYTICNLFLRYVLSGKTVDQILVVTFTNAATDELRGRIRSRLWQALRALQAPTLTTDPLLASLLEPLQTTAQQTQAHDTLQLAVRSMDEAAIFTIHGFCQRALTDHMLNSGGDFEQRQISNDDPLWLQALADWWRRTAYPLSAAEVTLLLQSLRSFEYFSALQKPLRHQPFVRLWSVCEQTLQELLRDYNQLQPALCRIAAQWQAERMRLTSILRQSPALSRGPYKAATLDAALNRLDAYFQSDQRLPVSKDFPLLTSDYLLKSSKPSKRGSDPALEDCFFANCNQLHQQQETLQRHFLARALFEATAFARSQVVHRQQTLQVMDFPDLLLALHKALQGPSAKALIKQLREHYPVAMIDEFQDTDSLQYAIFNKLYQAQQNTTLTLIGDPKQAIYGFRGGDIFSYIQAREDPALQHYTLEHNWRSSSALIKAVNTIFSRRPDPFVFDQVIHFQPVKSGTDPTSEDVLNTLRTSARKPGALTLWQIPRSDKTTKSGEQKYLPGMSRIVANATAAEIAWLLSGTGQRPATLGNKTLQANDIAVLVRTRDQGNQVRQGLLTHGIRAVTISHDSVFHSSEARGLIPLLEAILSPQDYRLAHTALASSLLNLSYEKISELLAGETNWLAWLEQLQQLQKLWQQQGFMAMFLQLLQCHDMGQRLSAITSAERKLTNLLHLAELLQQASKSRHDLQSLYAWFTEQIQNEAADESELRLESDANLVHIVTIHASKGLEYEVVFVPFLWNYRASAKTNGLLRLHDANNHPLMALAGDLDPKWYRRAEKERLAEDVRLTYVALTRARIKVYLAWGSAIKTSTGTALAYLLHPSQTATDLDHELPCAFASPGQVTTDLQQLAQAGAGSIEILPLPMEQTATRASTVSPSPPLLETAVFTRQFTNPWRISSFSSLTQAVHQPTLTDRQEPATDPIIAFPAGSAVGLFLHRVLEQLNFYSDTQQQLQQLCQREMFSQAFDSPGNRERAIHWLQAVIDTPLNHDNLRLRDIPASDCLRELAFDYAVADLDMSALQQQLQQLAGEPLIVPDSGHLRGLMTGVIDLIFQTGERFYIVDYKSNFLGPHLADYQPQALRKAIFARRYDLQYMLYSLALHRYLRFRLRNYQYRRHFGGIYYLFLRGMRPETGPDCGIYSYLPPENQVEILDQQICAAGPRGEITC